MVKFSDLAFHLRSPGDLTDAEIDEVLDFLMERINTQEKVELFQLQNFYNTLKRFSNVLSTDVIFLLCNARGRTILMRGSLGYHMKSFSLLLNDKMTTYLI